MKKIPSLFVRDYENVITDMRINEASLLSDGTHGIGASDVKSKKGRFLATVQVTPGCEWVINGEGVATRKWDGTAVLFMNGKWFKRYDAKHGKTPPPDFFEAQPEPDPITGHWPGWVPVVDDYKVDKYIVEAIWNFTCAGPDPVEGQTYEAVGPQINGDRDKWPNHMLKQHGADKLMKGFRFTHTFDGLREYLEKTMPGIEGIVFHHPDGRMCKVKRSDFGLKW
jgi:hypothetical protein